MNEQLDLGLDGHLASRGPTCAGMAVPANLPVEVAEATFEPDPGGEIIRLKDPKIRPVNRPAPERHAGTQGKCPSCKECYRWHSRRPLRLAFCPACGDKLRGTTHLNAWPWNIGVEPLTEVQAWQKFHKA